MQVLDHGYIKHIESWGMGEAGLAEAGIIEAARQSTQGSFRGWDQDERLLKFMYSHHHSTPFEFAGMVIEVQAPIFVFREWHRHRTQSYNEMSARYAPLPDLCYMPTEERLLMTQVHNRQAQGLKVIDSDDASDWLRALGLAYQTSEMCYRSGLESGVPKEIARVIMPVGHYSRMRASANLRNWLAFLTLRMHPDAQWEIRQFANALGRIVQHEFPRTWRLFEGSDEAGGV